MNYDNIARFAYTHPDNKGKSLREISRLVDINPGTLFRILVRLGLVTPRPPKQHPDFDIPDSGPECCPICGFSDTRGENKNSSATATATLARTKKSSATATFDSNPLIDRALQEFHTFGIHAGDENDPEKPG